MALDKNHRKQGERAKQVTRHRLIWGGVGKEREEREEYGDIRAEVSAKNSKASSTGR